jgi:16S rRNA (cytosine967-C5)-methyltransferase
VFEQGAYADRALHTGARDLDARDRALAMRLSYGAVQRKGTLDYLIERLTERPLARLQAPVRAALRLGLYELLFASGAPDRAVVADAVELVKRSGGGSAAAAAGLVNAVLRRAAVAGPQLLGELDCATAEEAALMHSHPVWVARLWFAQLGDDDARALMAADNEPAEMALRVNTLCTSPEALRAALPADARRDGCLDEALVLDGAFDAHASAPWRDGWFVAQARAAMLVSHVLDPQPGERVLDLCAAPGGKTTHIAALMQGRGGVVAVERSRGRAEKLESTLARLGAQNVTVEVADARVKRRAVGAEAKFDRVLVDPPCSGLGTLQGNPDLRWRITPERVDELATQQRLILDSAAAAVGSGGVLVYSTCTISPKENERTVGAFLNSNHDFRLEDLGVRWPDLRMNRVGGQAAEHELAPKLLLTLPHRDRTTGFFIARLRRD